MQLSITFVILPNFKLILSNLKIRLVLIIKFRKWVGRVSLWKSMWGGPSYQKCLGQKHVYAGLVLLIFLTLGTPTTITVIQSVSKLQSASVCLPCCWTRIPYRHRPYKQHLSTARSYSVDSYRARPWPHRLHGYFSIILSLLQLRLVSRAATCVLVCGPIIISHCTSFIAGVNQCRPCDISADSFPSSLHAVPMPTAQYSRSRRHQATVCHVGLHS